jgi:hypothetical protein
MTRRWFVLGGLIALAAAAAVLTQAAQAQTPGALRAGDTVLRGGWLFDATGDQAVRNTGILVRNGALLEVGADLSTDPQADFLIDSIFVDGACSGDVDSCGALQTRSLS